MKDDTRERTVLETYCRETGLNVRYSMDIYPVLYAFAERFAPKDIPLVVAYLRKIYRDKPDILRACLRLTKLLGDRVAFEEYLAEARALARAQVKQPDRAAVLRATGRPETEERPPVQVTDVLAKKKPGESWAEFVRRLCL